MKRYLYERAVKAHEQLQLERARSRRPLRDNDPYAQEFSRLALAWLRELHGGDRRSAAYVLGEQLETLAQDGVPLDRCLVSSLEAMVFG